MILTNNLTPDSACRTFLSNDISFVSFSNAILFDGKQVIHPERLVRYENDIRKRNVKYDQLPDMFFESYWNVIKSITKNELWKRSVKILETDSTFKELDIGSWISQEKSKLEKMILATEKSIEEKNNILYI